MTQERTLSNEDITTAQDKGRQKAADLLGQDLDDKILKSIYYRAVRAGIMALENFDTYNFERRGHKLANEHYLKGILLAAFQSVEMMGVVEAALNHETTKVIPAHSYLRAKLPNAALVFQFNGEIDQKVVVIGARRERPYQSSNRPYVAPDGQPKLAS